MNKRIRKGIAVAILVIVVAVFSFKYVKKDNVLSDLTMQNVEALAQNEWTPDGWSCFYNIIDNTTSDLFVVVISCRNCNSTTATYASYPGSCWH